MRSLWLMWLVHVLLSPLKFIVTFIIKCSWHPDLKKQTHDDVYIKKYDEIPLNELQLVVDKKLQTKYENFDHTLALTNDSDSPKWFGLMDAAFGHVTNKYWEILMSYIDDNGVIGRYAVNDPRRSEVVNFSGDMFSGLALSLALRLKRGVLSKEHREKLIKLWNKTTFESPVVTFAHPVTDKKNIDRGFIFPFYGIGSELTKLLCWFELGYQLTDNELYRKWYKRFKFISMPLLLLRVGDLNVSFGRIGIMKWFTYHSRICHMAAAYILNQDPIMKSHASHICHRYGVWNLDVRAIMERFFDMSMNKEELKSFYAGLLAVSEKGTLEYPAENLNRWYSAFSWIGWLPSGFYSNTKYLLNKITGGKISKLHLTENDIKNLGYKHILNADGFLSYEYLGQKYTSENTPLSPKSNGQWLRDAWGIDSLVPWGIFNQSLFKD